MPNSPVRVRCMSCKTLNRVPADKLNAHPVCGQCKKPLEVPTSPVSATTVTYQQQVEDWPELLLAEFWAKWCGYCRMMEPYLAELAQKRAGRLKVIQIDVDSEPMLASRFVIKATPAFILYRNGIQIGRLDGAPAKSSDLELWMDRELPGSFPSS
ncbi:MAG: thioredoxin domain-containing protein [Nitrospirota bacterium]